VIRHSAAEADGKLSGERNATGHEQTDKEDRFRSRLLVAPLFGLLT
jgi:hypothetical protein